MKFFLQTFFFVLGFVFFTEESTQAQNTPGQNTYNQNTFLQDPRFNQVLDSLLCRQLILVLSDNWNSLQGTLYTYEKKNGHWNLSFSNKVVLGSKGIGWGDGVLSTLKEIGPRKVEGDLKSPAGIFSLGTAFGYANTQKVRWLKWPYIKASDTLICVDDMHSKYYNSLINSNISTPDWKSFEKMRRQDPFYKWGLFINHNHNPVQPGDGSCIFMHIWKNDHSGTEGCTAMKEKNLLKVLFWLRYDFHPLLVQIPKEFLSKFSEKYSSPKY